jgi:phosphoenolpyruvate carboxylase
VKTPRHDDDLLSPELRALVKWSVSLLGETLEAELGKRAYTRIEAVRKRMAAIRTAKDGAIDRELEKTFRELERLGPTHRLEFARAYTLMLELMNSCENAYRTHRLKQRNLPEVSDGGNSVLYVLTAHPTEARSPDNIAVFHEIQKTLVDALERGHRRSEERLRSLLQIAWKVEIVRHRIPRVQDEAEHIYNVLLRDSNLSILLDAGRNVVPVYIRSWVGGDKDGHPGVDQVTMADSLQLSRTLLHAYAKAQVADLRKLVRLLDQPKLSAALGKTVRALDSVRKLRDGDGARMERMWKTLQVLAMAYRKNSSSFPLPLSRMIQLEETFPGLVVPLELREDSGVLMSDPSGKSLAIGRMLKKIGALSRGGNPTWYARGMIISMAQSLEHIQVTARMVKRLTGNLLIPVVPLFEQRGALEDGPKIIAAMAKDPVLGHAVRKLWFNKLEIMLGYSDSSKEGGVLPSRLAVTKAMWSLDRVCRTAKVTPVFFHGSGGSIDRGGGAIQDQMAGWPDSALRIYKATIQGEMIERNFASPEIAESQLFQILQTANRLEATRPTIPRALALDAFAERLTERYRGTIADPRFLRMVEAATPYRYLGALKIGSRPSKRAGPLAVSSLRAIPWILCWTQTRVLFPTWWGVGTAWKTADSRERQELKKLLGTHPVFRSYVHALGFTLAKIELPVWEFYLKRSGLPAAEISHFKSAFREEHALVAKFFRELTGEKNPVWFRPWLGKSIELRAAMIHPLNLLEILAQRDLDRPLLRVAVTGIASGMLTTG